MGELDPPDAFDILADETRLRILWALAEQRREAPDEGLRFAELRRRVGHDDSGNFDYHLDRLRGTFVEREGEAYELSLRGVRVVASLSTGAYETADPMDPTELGDPCPVCGEPLTARYHRGALMVGCGNDHGLSNLMSPEFVRETDVETLFGHLIRQSWHDLRAAADGVCALCDGPIRELDVEELPDGTTAYRGVCAQCGMDYQRPPQVVAVAHQAVSWFCYEHGVEVPGDPYRTMGLLFTDAERIPGDPPSHEVVMEVDEETLTLTVDDEPSVVDVERGG